MEHLPCVQNVLFHLVLTTTLGTASIFISPTMQAAEEANVCTSLHSLHKAARAQWNKPALRASITVAVSSCLVDAL